MAVHADLSRLDRRDEGLGQPFGARAGLGPGHVHQHFGHHIVLGAEVDASQQIVAVMPFGQGGRGLVAGLRVQRVNRRPHRLALGQSIGM